MSEKIKERIKSAETALKKWETRLPNLICPDEIRSVENVIKILKEEKVVLQEKIRVELEISNQRSSTEPAIYN